MGPILVVGSMAFDSIKTPEGEVSHELGGSANYFSLAAALYSQVRVVGVVGDDYTAEHLAVLQSREVNISGVERRAGKTFHWSGQYSGAMNEAQTLATELNVFQTFNPILPPDFRQTDYVFLANIDPELQLRVLEQVKSPRLVGCDTMNYWIQSKPDALKAVLSRVQVLFVNEGEANLLTGKSNAIAASKALLQMGPSTVVIKRGEYGFVLCHKNEFFILPAYPIAQVVDPTGAGDTFAGGFFGFMARVDRPFELKDLKQACVHGGLLASFTVQNFGLRALQNLRWAEVEDRHQHFSQIVSH